MADIPVAIAPSVRTPGTALVVDLLAGASSPGSSVARALIIAPKASTGAMTADTIKEGVGGEADVATQLGTGSIGHLAAKALFGEYGLAQVDLACCAEPVGVAASGTITFASSPTAARTVTSTIMGRVISTEWAASEAATVGAQRHRDAINVETRDLFVTATENGAGVITITAKHKGACGNDVTYSVKVTGGTGGTVTAAGANLTLGTGEIVVTTVLGLVQTSEYRYIMIVTSNADAIAATTTGAVGKTKIHIETYKSGFGAMLQTLAVGCTSTTATSPKAATAFHNYERGQFVFAQAFQSLPAEVVGAEVGARMREESIKPNVNRCKAKYKVALYGPLDRIGDKLTGAEVEDCLQHGISPTDFTGGDYFPVRPISMHYLDTDSNPDDRVLDIGRVISCDVVAKDLKTRIAQEFEGANVIDNHPVGEDIPEGVVEIREIKTFAKGVVFFWCTRGVVKKKEFNDAITDGTFIVRVNPSDTTQVDIVVPAKIVAILAKIGIVLQNKGP